MSRKARRLNLMAKRPTVSDVAREAGVSNTVVSHSLNDKGRVDPETRRRVKEVAERLGYVPSRAARNLALGRSDTIGLLLPELFGLPLTEILSSDWYGRVAIEASQAAIDRRQALTILPGVGTATDVAHFGIDGAIVADPIGDDPRCAALEAAGVKYVVLGRDPVRPEVPSVAPDTPGATLELLDHLHDAGARSIAAVSVGRDFYAGREAIGAFTAWCEAHSQEPRVIKVSIASHSSREAVGREAFEPARELLGSSDRPDAVVALLEDFGPAILEAARSLGLDVPGDLLVAQDVDGMKAQLVTPPLTAIDLHEGEQVQEAVRLLLEEDASDNRHVTTPVTLRIRESTMPGSSGAAA
jgi:DNA-binding LacI/PurR family transcriptional regulator